jgi:hypothetical protein
MRGCSDGRKNPLISVLSAAGIKLLRLLMRKTAAPKVKLPFWNTQVRITWTLGLGIKAPFCYHEDNQTYFSNFLLSRGDFSASPDSI